MRPSFRIFAVALALGASSGLASADNTIPRYFEFKYGGDLLWIAASEAITSSGTLRPDVPRPAHLQNHLAEQASRRPVVSDDAQPTEKCDVSYGRIFVDGPDEGAITSVATLNETIATRSVISGTVTASELGLHYGIPHTILQIDPEPDADSVDRVYLMFPRGRLRFEGVTFCNEDPTVAGLPAIGDPIMFVASYPLDSAGTLFSTTWIVYEQKSRLTISQHFLMESDARPKSVRGFAQDLRASQGRERRQ
jgi:hypothetical protein